MAAPRSSVQLRPTVDIQDIPVRKPAAGQSCHSRRAPEDTVRTVRNPQEGQTAEVDSSRGAVRLFRIEICAVSELRCLC